MQTSRRWVRRALGSGAVGALTVTTACLSVTWPTTVESGPYGAPGGGSNAEADGGTPGEDATTPEGDGATGEGVLCNTPTALMCLTATDVPSDIATQLMMSCGGTLFMSGTCPTQSLLGCCQMNPGYISQTCYYTGSAATQSTMAGCVAAAGTWSLVPNSL